MGRLVQASQMPRSILLPTIRLTRSISLYNNEAKRALVARTSETVTALGHSRLRRTARPSSASRESMTFVSSDLQRGQNIEAHLDKEVYSFDAPQYLVVGFILA